MENVNRKKREKRNGQTMNEICEWCEKGIKLVMGINK